MLPYSFKYLGDFFDIRRCWIVSRICNTQISSYNIVGAGSDIVGSLLSGKKIKERSELDENCCSESTKVFARYTKKYFQN